MKKNEIRISELLFYFNPIPNENEENYKMKLINI